jgi:ATP-dependent DNA helicase RecG
MEDLDLDLFRVFLRKTNYGDTQNWEHLLTNWRLLDDGHPTVAGILLLGRWPQRHLPYAQIDAAKFSGIDSSVDPIDRRDLTGSLLEVIEEAERFLDRYLSVSQEICFELEAKPELPKEALLEAIVNAVAHRDYTIQGPIRLFVFDDRIEIRSPGMPPSRVTVEAMRAGVHVVRNPWIYVRLSDAGLVARPGLVLLCQTESRGLAFLQRFVVKSSPGGI